MSSERMFIKFVATYNLHAIAPTKEATTDERAESPTSTSCSPVKLPGQTSKCPSGLTNSRFCQSAQKQTRHSTTQTTDHEPVTTILPAVAQVSATTPSPTTTTTTTPPPSSPSPLPPPPPSVLSTTALATHNHNIPVPHPDKCECS